MSKYDSISVSDFLKEMPKRIDGRAACVVIALFTLLGIAGPSLGLQVGKLQGWGLTGTLLGLVPLVFLKYVYLVYFTSGDRLSMLINAGLILAVPILVIFYA